MGRTRTLALASLVFAASSSYGADPTSITYKILQSDCHGAGVDTLTLVMNGVTMATVPAKAHCNCGESALIVTITNPVLLALYDPSQCNSFAVSSAPNAPGFGFVKVTVTTATGSTDFCAFDGSLGNPTPTCADRML